MYQLNQWSWFRWLLGGTWHYVRVTNPYDFTHMSYWIDRTPTSNEAIVKTEVYEK